MCARPCVCVFCVFVHVCVYVPAFVFARVFVSVSVRVNVCLCSSVYVCVYVCVQVDIFVNMCVCVRLCVCPRACGTLSLRVWVYVRIFIHTNTKQRKFSVYGCVYLIVFDFLLRFVFRVCNQKILW